MEELLISTTSVAPEISTHLGKFSVDLPIFEGHFDVLLTMIKEQNVDIADIPLADITRQYLEYLSLAQSLDLSFASEFLVIAAYLIELKSKRLLPEKKKEEEDVENIESALIDHVAQYRLFKKVAQILRERKDIFSKIYHRFKMDYSDASSKQYFLRDVSVSDLVGAFRKIWLEVHDRQDSFEIIDEVVTVDDKIKQISEKLKNCGEGLYFDSLFKTKTRLEVIVTFLALLELIRLKMILIKQEDLFGKILLFPIMP